MSRESAGLQATSLEVSMEEEEEEDRVPHFLQILSSIFSNNVLLRLLQVQPPDSHLRQDSCRVQLPSRLLLTTQFEE